jgi:hypothetical protein
MSYSIRILACFSALLAAVSVGPAFAEIASAETGTAPAMAPNSGGIALDPPVVHQGKWRQVERDHARDFVPIREVYSKLEDRLAGSTPPAKWDDDIMVYPADSLAKNALLDFDVTDGTMYAFAWNLKDATHNRMCVYRAALDGLVWYHEGSVWYPHGEDFSDADFVYCDSIAVCVGAVQEPGAEEIQAYGLNVKANHWNPSATVFSTATDSILSLSIATDYDNYPTVPYVYLAAHIGDKIHFWTSLDKGLSWERHAVVDSGDVSFPDIAYGWDSGGEIYLTYMSGNRLCLARNTNFGNPLHWTTDWASWPITDYGRMSVVAAFGDTIHVLFERYHSITEDVNLELRSTVDQGANWYGAYGTSYSGEEFYPDITGRGGKFRMAYLHFDGLDRYVEHRECLNSETGWWGTYSRVNDHYPYWDRKPYGNPCIENLPGGNAGIMYTGYHENRRVWLDLVESPVGVSHHSVETLLPTASVLPIRNPADGLMDVSFALPYTARAELDVFDVRGRRVARLAGGRFEPGTHTCDWDTTDLPSGMYFIKLLTEQDSVSRKVMVIH